MNMTDIVALSPFIVLASTATGVLLVSVFYRNHAASVLLTVAGLSGSFGALFKSAEVAPRTVTSLIIADGYGLFFIGLICLTGIVVACLSFGYLKGRRVNPDEYYVLLLLATLGSAILVSAGHFASFFLGLEILSLSLYSLIAYLRAPERGNEAGIKYLILAAVSASFLLFGMALIYARLGTMEFAKIAVGGAAFANDPILLSGLVLIVIGVGFKLAIVPFHMWTPDVYEGAPAPVSAFVATVSKGAMFALLLRFFAHIELHNYPGLVLLLSVISAASMFAGNLLALFQRNVKRILAYSSIAHQGYLLVAFLAGRGDSVMAVSYYLLAYFVSMLGAFGVITVISGKERDADTIDDYHGMAWRNPWLSAVLTVMLLSLAGIPLTGGFLGKYYVMAAGVGSALWVLVVILAVNSAIGLYYYLRIVAALFSVPAELETQEIAAVEFSNGIMVSVLAVIIFALGIYPAPVLRIVRDAIAGLI